ncbi:MAG: RNA pyrophosphohydrolase [Rhodospirillaceae bacterium]|jgi:putative (di)nucleoside polyphosphate hydrolase|nr:RNA pyrophosphohydrolase [Rhodospirillaceae bacterium]MBT3766704.1 RNA pyrophosphohydrolase [Rhodospirillales bacterium]MBT3909591.1 RNA pyrophosphohydrolase [Rhodospirillaceae bacterium]MBT5299199.1 RNA pyrophosphohydrolase [Rhodospirillaceae bacterium]MBT5513180.1 RNA pyrophosphohydrolase [Rhodospirillaceae bacterium]
MGEDCVTADDKALGELPYRRGVGAALFNGKGEVWVGRRIAKIGQDLENYWQLPQGGIDHDEAPSEAVFRELLEETGTNRASIVAETEGWLTYDLPADLQGVAWGGHYRGQEQKWFALSFNGDDGDFKLDAHDDPEFDAWQWVEFSTLPSLIVPFKRGIYEGIVGEFANIPTRVRSQL